MGFQKSDRSMIDRSIDVDLVPSPNSRVCGTGAMMMDDRDDVT